MICTSLGNGFCLMLESKGIMSLQIELQIFEELSYRALAARHSVLNFVAW
jgi:hypothetical protein